MRSFLVRYERELADSVIPFWERHGVDEECGGYFNCLDRDGSVYDTDKHLWMQWRMVYMFATLAGTRFAEDRRERWIAIARHGFRFLVDRGRDQRGSYYFALNRRGEPTHLLKGGKWKCFFHLPRCLLECIGHLERIEER